MTKLLIPHKMRVGRKKYLVRIVRRPTYRQHQKDVGMIDYVNKLIEVATHNKDGKDLTAACAYETFWHELTHAILHDMKRYTLNRDEAFVEGFAKRLSTAILTAEFLP